MQRRLIVLVGIMMLVTPVAAAWGVKGSVEPSTRFDQIHGYMPLDLPQSIDKAGKVYFNGWLSASYIYHNSFNPNVGVVAGQASMNTNTAPPITVPWAILGVWMDCNKDGYIGLGDPGLIEYPTSVPGIDLTICPVKAVTKFPDQRGEQPEVHTAPRGLTHNDGEWVHELIPIGWNDYGTLWDASDEQNQKYNVDPLADDNPWDLNDSASRVWMDVGLPDSRGTGVSGCWYLGYPRGTLHSTGGIIWAHDCYTNYRVTDTLNQQASVIDSTPAGQISFKDQPRSHQDSASRLNQKNPWGDERDGSYVQPWDCKEKPRNIDNPTTTDPDWLEVSVLSFRIQNISNPRVPPGGAQPNASPAGTLNETQSGFDECNRSPKNTSGNAWYNQFEGDRTNSALRIQPTNSFFYQDGFRRQGPHATVWGAANGPSPGTPNDFGARVTGWESCQGTAPGPVFVAPCHGGFWRGNQQFLFLEGRLLNRATMAISPVGYQTFYAFVGPEATATFNLKLPANVGSYGSENCALPASERLFECDATKWWPGETMPRTGQLGPDRTVDPLGHRCAIRGAADRCMPYGVRPGQAYQFRDIDCTDHSADPLRDEGVHYGVLTGTACSRPAK